MFHVGQHVVCIKEIPVLGRKAAERMHKVPLKAPELNRVYTVRNLHTAKNGALYLLLEEIINPLNYRGKEPTLHSRIFRPLKKLSVADFTTTKEPVNA